MILNFNGRERGGFIVCTAHEESGGSKGRFAMGVSGLCKDSIGARGRGNGKREHIRRFITEEAGAIGPLVLPYV